MPLTLDQLAERKPKTLDELAGITPKTLDELAKPKTVFPKIDPDILAIAKRVVAGEKAPKFDPEGIGYDYETSIASGGKPDPISGHWGSLEPRTGMVLKGRKHPTWDLMEEEEKRRGSKIVKRGNRYYSDLAGEKAESPIADVDISDLVSPYPNIPDPKDIIPGAPHRPWRGIVHEDPILRGFAKAAKLPELFNEPLPEPVNRLEKVAEFTGAAVETVGELYLAGAGLAKAGLLPMGRWLFPTMMRGAMVFGTQEASQQVRIAVGEELYEEDFGGRGKLAVAEAMVIGGLLSAGTYGIGKVWKAWRPAEKALARKVLGVRRGATINEIKIAFRKQAMTWHPDKFIAKGANPAQIKTAQTKFDELVKARDLLSKHKKVVPEIIRRATRPKGVEPSKLLPQKVSDAEVEAFGRAIEKEITKTIKTPPTRAIPAPEPSVAPITKPEAVKPPVEVPKEISSLTDEALFEKFSKAKIPSSEATALYDEIVLRKKAKVAARIAEKPPSKPADAVKPSLEARVDKAFKENDLDELVKLRNEAKGEFGNKLTMLISEVEYRNLDKLSMGQLRNKARYNNVPTNLSRAEMIRQIKQARKPLVIAPTAEGLTAKENEIYQEAKSDFEKALANTSQEDIEKAKVGFGISAMKFARRYIEPKKNQKLYDKIYSIVYDHFENLKAQPPAIAEGENVTQEKLTELRGQVGRTSERYGISQARAGKAISKTEQNILAQLPDELDLGPWSGVLLYSPKLKGFSKPEHSAIIKLVDRGQLKVFRESRPVSKEYTTGFTYVLRKTKPPTYISEARPKPLAEGSKGRRREILQARLKRGESVVPKLLSEFESEKWAQEALKEKPGAPSKIGFPRGAAEIELPAEAIGKEPVSAEQIITGLSKALKVPYRSFATHRRRTAAGFYAVRPVGIRQINVRDLETAAHEAGHHIDHFWKIRRAGISKIGRKTWRMPEGTAKGTAAELTRLGKMLYGDKRPKGGYRSEGIAEFIRGYLTGHLDIKKEAPKFYNWFTKDYLPNNPEVATALQNARDMLTDYRLQGAEARIESQISRKEIAGSLRDRAKRANLWMQQMFIDEFAPLRKGMEEAGIERAKLKPTEDPYELAVYYSQKEGARARQMVLFGTIDLWGNKTGKGLKEIMKPIADENSVRPFTHYIVAARSLDLWKRGIDPGIKKADAQHVYDLYKDNPGWKETAQEITDWNGRVLDYLVQGGALESSIAKRMRELNPVYVPFLRAFAKGEKQFGGGGAGRGLITTKKGVFGIKGSGREIIDPFESMIIQTRRMISIAHKSVIARALANLEERHRGLAGLIWKVPAPKRAMTFQAEQVKKQLMKMGVEFPEGGLEEMDALLTVYGNSPIYLGKDNIIAIVQNGKKSWYEVNPEMYRLLQGLDKFYLPRFLDVTFGKPGRAVRLGATGINASFGLVRNPIRDSLDTIFKGTHARGPLASVEGVAKDLSRLGLAKSLGIDPSKAAQEFVAQGGQISGFVGQDRKSLQHLRGEMLASSVGRYSIHTLNHPVDALREVFGVAESGPRIKEYEKALKFAEKKYGKGSPDAKIYAFNKAQDQTINYSRHGVIGKWLNQMIPFWNANAQDPAKVYRTFATRGAEATAYAVAFLTLPALGLWWYNKDEEWYKELPAYETANYLHVKVPGKDAILRIPVPFLVGHIFQSTPVVMMDALYRADPQRIKEHFDHVLKGDVYPLAEWPAIVSPLIDVLQNKDWAGRPIIPRGLEGKLPSDQYKEYTTEFCKVVARVLNKGLPRGKEISPLQLEYMLNAYSGGLYRRTGRIAGIVTKAPEEIQPADWPVIGAIIVRDPYAPKRSIERFYEEKEHLNRMYQSDKIKPESDLDRKRKRYNYISTKFLSPYWDKLQKTKAVAERKKIYQKIGVLIKKAQK